MKSIKSLIKIIVAEMTSAVFSPSTERVVVLCYHSVHPNKSFSSVSPDLFEAHLEWLSKNAQVIPFYQALSFTGRNVKKRGKPAVAITFDDGYADNWEYAFPLLQRYGFSATFFVTVGLLEKDSYVMKRFLYLRRCNPEEITPLSWFQVREMRKAGMEIGVHTWSHPNLARLKPSEVKLEFQRSKDVLEDRLGEPVDLLAYPFGKHRRHFKAETIEIAQSLGFRYGAAVAFRAVSPSDHPLSVPRFFVTGDSVKTLAQKVYGAWDWLGWWQEKAPFWLARFISRKDFAV